jgi:hypothetical protein
VKVKKDESEILEKSKAMNGPSMTKTMEVQRTLGNKELIFSRLQQMNPK